MCLYAELHAHCSEAVAFTFNQIDLIKRLQSAYPTQFSLPPNGTTALSAFKNGQIISPIAIEGLHQIGNSFSNLRTYYDLGVRYATLTHNCHNVYADAAIVELPSGNVAKSTPYWGGVSLAGRKLVHEMNRIGMIVVSVLSIISVLCQQSCRCSRRTLNCVILSLVGNLTLTSYPF